MGRRVSPGRNKTKTTFRLREEPLPDDGLGGGSGKDDMLRGTGEESQGEADGLPALEGRERKGRVKLQGGKKKDERVQADLIRGQRSNERKRNWRKLKKRLIYTCL